MTDPQVLKKNDWGVITPEIAGWEFITFEVRVFERGEKLVLDSDGVERALVNLSGDFTADVDGTTYEFGGRSTVFDGLGHTLYVPLGSTVTINATDGAELAIATSPATEKHDVVLVTPADLPLQARGAGTATRQVATPMSPDFPADRLHVVEVYTPGGNWSSYPPHKHEHDEDGEAQLEEIYYYRLRDSENGWALQRVYSPERSFELDVPVRDGDICLLPWGYHTTVAAHDQDLYYLNVLAGPAPARTLQARQDPVFAGAQAKWDDLAVDDRVPFVPQYPTA
ncbi:5-deoxyglucuronate isomerase [Frondihabitans sp. PhB188]|uniref:5-deoxy-glucuronate isomerase n=1 Tax=Frondihabitans sp. PhB188 TaxID=2485200 RepID=UPI000F4A02A9|nr:5-deoxy-glucuronate isomerase [Frondihabitans sp. PhB188]ROQ30306.1 5-deoxyglucuronate isomerase [Frondihabitans sp. PhB188]